MKIRWHSPVADRWISLADLVLVMMACGLWEWKPQLGWIPLLVALLPWGARILTRRFPFRRTSFDIPILLFLLTAVIAAGTAYSQENALAKFWLVIAGVLFFYSLAGQPAENRWSIAALMSISGLALTVYFIFTNDWLVEPADFAVIQRVGLWWMNARPSMGAPSLDSHDVAGLIGLILPFQVAFVIRFWQEKRKIFYPWLVAAAFTMLIALLLLGSLALTLAIAAGFGLWTFWGIVQLAMRSKPEQARNKVFISFLLAVVVLFLLIIFFLGGRTGLEPLLLRSSLFKSRVELAIGAVKLIGDFPFTGAGLGSFPGLHSQYILNIPYFFILNSHDIFLDVAVELGLAGLLAFAAIYLGSLTLAIQAGLKSPGDHLVWASSAAMVITILYGLINNILFGPRDAPLVFLLPGVILAMTRNNTGEQTGPVDSDLERQHGRTGRRRLWFAISAILILTSVLVGFRGSVLAAWYANLGSLRMARVELVDFPKNHWAAGEHLTELASAEADFNESLRYNPDNRTANHRLGLIAMTRRDYPSAVSFLEKAYHSDPWHPGIIKSLGLAYTWNGQFVAAQPLLSQIPDVQQELGAYAWWWTTQGRADLSKNAETMAGQIPVQSNSDVPR